MVGADVPGGPPPARTRRDVRQPSRARAWGAERARGTRAPTNVGAIVRQGQPTWEARSDAMRRGRRGYFARQAVGGEAVDLAVGGVLVDGGAGPGRDKRGPPVWPRCRGRGCKGRGISRRSSSEVKSRIPKPAARRRAKYPRRPRHGTSKQGPAQGPAATSAALPCGRGCRGRAISRRSSSEVKSRIPKPAARRRAKYPRHPRRGTSKRARRRARPRQARPSRVAEGVGDARFHVGTVPPGRYAARRRAKYPRRPSARDVQAGPAQGPAATSAALPCGRGCRGRAISRRSNSARKIRSGPAREVPAPPSARDVQAGPAQGPAATSAALPCRRGEGDARFHVGAVPK